MKYRHIVPDFGDARVLVELATMAEDIGSDAFFQVE
jgi:hypothetical protein